MTQLADIKKRVLYVKYLLSRAKDAGADRNELGVAVSLLLMHDAVEMLLHAVVIHRGIQPKKRTWEFMEYWGLIDPEPPQRTFMESFNKMRVALKHNGVLPNPQEVRDRIPRVEIFCEDVAKDHLDLDFASLSMAILVANEDARNALGEAEQAIATADKDDAFVKLRIAFEIIFREASTETTLIRQPTKGSTGDHLLDKAIEQSVQTLNVLTFGIDPIKYRFFVRNTPTVSWSGSGPYWNLQRDYNNVSDNVFWECYRFVVDVSLKLGAVFRASSVETP